MFLTPKASADDRSPWGDFWFSPVASSGGALVSADSAMQLSAVYACVRILAESVSTLPFVVYRKKTNGGKQPVLDHWLYRLFARRPNEFQNPMEFREMMQGHLALRGNAFSRIHATSSGEVTDLIPYHPDMVRIEMLPGTGWRYRVLNPDGTEDIVARHDMFHIKGLSPNMVIGYSPIELQRKTLGAGIAAQDYGLRFFENDARPGGWLEHPTNFKTDEQRRQWRESWQEQQAGRNRHKTAVLEYGLKYHELKVSNDDAQFIETRKMNRSEIAAMFGVPPHRIGDLERATFSNIEQQSLDFVVNTLTAWLVRWEEAIRFNFLDHLDDSLFVEFPVTSLLRGDSSARSKYYHDGILDGWLTRNEARLSESLEPLDGLDEPLRPLNMVEESDAEDQEDAVEPLAQPKQQDLKPTQDEKARLSALAVSAAERVARKEVAMILAAAKSSDWPAAIHGAMLGHANFVAAALGVPDDAARRYCESRISDPVRGGYEEEDIHEAALAKLTRLALTGEP